MFANYGQRRKRWANVDVCHARLSSKTAMFVASVGPFSKFVRLFKWLVIGSLCFSAALVGQESPKQSDQAAQFGEPEISRTSEKPAYGSDSAARLGTGDLLEVSVYNVPELTSKVRVDNNGDIDATYFDSSGYAHGVLYYNSSYYPFDDPKASNSTRADGLNNSLHIVGRYSPSDGSNHGFMATAK